ncbi:type VII secretion protein EssA [Peribacillus sp. SI8-4]|uniref:type VII secretion protein EssA n=1 Tax=Peribacillus sp. SI8-4 TaxID=3048009 RepID=UPI00255558AE|nr:type VII secretion protein EssA [Peribacillus sp. SI8-4]
MKRIKCVMPIVFTLFFSHAPHGDAEEQMVEPNEYQEKDIDVQTEYFHEEGLLEQKQRLPEEQKDLTFERGKYDAVDSMKDSLFHSPVENHNTIASKAEQLGLFKETGSRMASEEEEAPSMHVDLTILLGIILALSVVCLFFILIPKMGKLSGEAKRK